MHEFHVSTKAVHGTAYRFLNADEDAVDVCFDFKVIPIVEILH